MRRLSSGRVSTRVSRTSTSASGRPAPRGVLRGAEQLLGEEGVALAAGVHPFEQPRVDGPRDRAVQQLGDLGVRKAGQRYAFDIGTPSQLGQQGPQRVPAVDVVRPVAHDECDPTTSEGAGQEGQQVAGAAVGPVDVLDDEQDRRRFGEGEHDAVQRLEQLYLREFLGRFRTAPGVTGVGEVGEQAGEHRAASGFGAQQRGAFRGRFQRVQGVDDRDVGQSELADLDACADQNSAAGRSGARGDLLEEPGLADPGIAAHDRQPRHTVGRRVEHRCQLGELVGAADETACSGARHPLILADLPCRSVVRYGHGVEAKVATTGGR